MNRRRAALPEAWVVSRISCSSAAEMLGGLSRRSVVEVMAVPLFLEGFETFRPARGGSIPLGFSTLREARGGPMALRDDFDLRPLRRHATWDRSGPHRKASWSQSSCSEACVSKTRQ